MSAKYIFVTGGVVSSLGKGLAAASIGCLMESRGLKVTLLKFDPYLNVDPGTMSPFQHGEVFVTDDGAETDLDLGHYERFTHCKLTRDNNWTTGRIYETIIAKERRGDYLGKTVQVIPHVTNEIKSAMKKVAQDVDLAIIEIGGTVGDIESLPFIEAIRQMRQERGRENTLFVHVTLVPYIAAAGELKTKPTQHSVKELLSVGIQPDILLCRTDRFLSKDIKSKIALFCNVENEAVITAKDVASIYEVPLVFAHEGVDRLALRYLHMDAKEPDLASTALLWNGSVFNPIAVAGTPGELPGTNLQDVDVMALNNNGEVAARCIVASPRNCLLFAGSDGVPHTLFFDGSAAGGVTNLRNFFTTRFGLHDNSAILFRADYWNFGSTVNQTGLFTVYPSGATTLVVPAGTKLPGMAAPYTFNTDFGIANDGSILFSVTSGSASALFRLGPDQSIARVIGTGDPLNGSAVTSIGSVAVGKNGHYAVMANNGTQNLLLSAGDPTKFRQLPITSYNSIFAVSGAGEVVLWCGLAPGYGLYRWDGTKARTVALYGFPSPLGDPYTQFDSAGYREDAVVTRDG